MTPYLALPSPEVIARYYLKENKISPRPHNFTKSKRDSAQVPPYTCQIDITPLAWLKKLIPLFSKYRLLFPTIMQNYLAIAIWVYIWAGAVGRGVVTSLT